jgi:2-oxoglutarate dehydrogenase E1 component
VTWVQEEHMNQGSWTYVKPRLESLLKHSGQTHRLNVAYAGRGPSSASATGHHNIHEKELEDLLKLAFQ